MTVEELRNKLAGLESDMPVVVIGHFGEGISLHAGECGTQEDVKVVDRGWAANGTIYEEVFVLPAADVGPYPD